MLKIVNGPCETGIDLSGARSAIVRGDIAPYGIRLTGNDEVYPQLDYDTTVHLTTPNGIQVTMTTPTPQAVNIQHFGALTLVTGGNFRQREAHSASPAIGDVSSLKQKHVDTAKEALAAGHDVTLSYGELATTDAVLGAVAALSESDGSFVVQGRYRKTQVLQQALIRAVARGEDVYVLGATDALVPFQFAGPFVKHAPSSTFVPVSATALVPGVRNPRFLENLALNMRVIGIIANDETTSLPVVHTSAKHASAELPNGEVVDLQGTQRDLFLQLARALS